MCSVEEKESNKVDAIEYIITNLNEIKKSIDEVIHNLNTFEKSRYFMDAYMAYDILKKIYTDTDISKADLMNTLNSVFVMKTNEELDA